MGAKGTGFCVVVAMVLLTSCSLLAGDNTSDNAALLYQQAIAVYQKPSKEVKKMLRELYKGEITPNEQIREHVNKNQAAINYTLKAAEIENFDWSVEASNATDPLMTEGRSIFELSILLISDAKILAQDGEYETALARCLDIHKVDRHFGEHSLTYYLVSVQLSKAANECIVDILGSKNCNAEKLSWLRDQLINVANNLPSIKEGLDKEKSISKDFEKERIETMQFSTENMKQQSLNESQEFFAKSRKNYINYITEVQAAFELPYAEANEKLKEINDTVFSDKKPEAYHTKLFSQPAVKLNSIDARNKNSFNAVIVGLEVYIIHAATSQLPDVLAASSQRDIFSGKNFIYERNEDSFVLRCQGKDLDEDRIHEYKFKIK